LLDELLKDDGDGEENFNFDHITADLVFKEFYTVVTKAIIIEEEKKEEIKTCPE